MTSGLRMMVDPMSRYKQESIISKNALEMASKIDPENPRITLIKAEDAYFTPEQFGGSKTNGIALFKKAITQFNNYQIKSKLHPNWGKSEAEYFVNKP